MKLLSFITLSALLSISSCSMMKCCKKEKEACCKEKSSCDKKEAASCDKAGAPACHKDIKEEVKKADQKKS
ncbi:MAG TPA: hypothetical protein VNJ08_08420 [Bacteriovoracaceae bacterium]|nr:hypothetical protein [Bacteriovoracaceae bacterium]